MINYWRNNSEIKDRIYIPKYYDPLIQSSLLNLSESHNLLSIKKLIADCVINVETGHEIGKLAYGTGDIPFVRTSDISNWEIKTAPKQGVSEDIYLDYCDTQDVQVGDILLVRDGTYLIGSNCIVTAIDQKILYQSHILKIRVIDKEKIDPNILFLALNSDIVQKQIRSFQFTADTIDTIGNRYLEILLPIPKEKEKVEILSQKVQKAIDERERGKAFIKSAPVLLEEVLAKNTVEPIKFFLSKSLSEVTAEINQKTVTSEFGHFEAFWHNFNCIKERIFLPKYYDPGITAELSSLTDSCRCVTIEELEKEDVIEQKTGDEIGKMAYGTGKIPFVRTTDFSNWEIKHDPKQGVSEEIYEEYSMSQDVMMNDILLVRDGTYLIGSSCIITGEDKKILYCGGLIKFRILDDSIIDSWLLLGLFNSFIVKRQMRTKQFTRDVIDTLGKRISEVILPIPKSKKVRNELSELIKKIVTSRIDARNEIKSLALELMKVS